MPTLKQKLAVDKLVENPGRPIGSIMREVGYDENSANTPKSLTESKGFKELMDQAGLTPGLVVKALADDIKSKPEKRLGELRLGAEILGLTKQDQNVAIQVNFGEFREKYG